MAVDYLITQFASRGGGQLQGTINGLAGSFDRLETASQRSQRIGTNMMNLGAKGVTTFANIAKGALQAAGEVSRVEVGYRTILKNEKAVRELSKGVRDFDVKSPFSYLDSARGSQQLLAAGFRGKELMDTMEGVGSAVVSAGKGTPEFVRLLAVMSKIKTQGVLTAVRVNQFAAAGVNVKEILKEKLGLTDEQMMNIGKLHLKADVVIPALIEGLNEKFKGGLEKAAGTYLGSLETLQGAEDKFKASIGKSIEKDAIVGVKGLTALINKGTEWAALHPRMTKGLLVGGGIGSLALMGAGYLKVRSGVKLAEAALKNLAGPLGKDVGLEKQKTGVAGAEELARKGAAGAATKQATALQRLNGLQNSAKALAARGVNVPGIGARTVGQVGMGAAVGAATGYAFYDTYSDHKNQAAVKASLGIDVTDTQAKVGGAVVGGVVAAMAIAAPEIAAPILATLALIKGGEWLGNKLINEPMEKKAETGSGAENEDLYGKGMDGRLKAAQAENAKTKSAASYRNLADVYSDMAGKSGDSGDMMAARQNLWQAGHMREMARRAGTGGSVEGDIAQQRAMVAGATNIPDKERFLATWEQQRRNGTIGPTYGQPGGNPEWEKEVQERERLYGGRETPKRGTLTPQGQAQNTQTRNNDGTTTVRVVQEFVMQPSYADQQARRTRSNTFTPRTP